MKFFGFLLFLGILMLSIAAFMNGFVNGLIVTGTLLIVVSFFAYGSKIQY